jgi:hypothetical protein
MMLVDWPESQDCMGCDFGEFHPSDVPSRYLCLREDHLCIKKEKLIGFWISFTKPIEVCSIANVLKGFIDDTAIKSLKKLGIVVRRDGDG